MHEVDYVRTLAALLAVLGAIGLGAFVMQRLDVAGRLARRPGAAGPRVGSTAGRLDVVESRWLDQKTRLVVTRWDAAEHLVLIGPTGVTVVESRPGAPHAAACNATIDPAEAGSMEVPP